MKFTTFFSAAASAVIVVAQSATGQTFQLIAIRSGSAVQNSPINIANGALTVGGDGQAFIGQVKDGKLVTADGQSVGKDDQNHLVLGKDGQFSTDSQYLSIDGSQAFTAARSDSGYALVAGSAGSGSGSSSDNIPITLKIQAQDASSNSTNNQTTATATLSSTQVSTGVAVATVTDCGDKECHPAPTESGFLQVNGAGANLVNGAAVVAAGVAAALF